MNNKVYNLHKDKFVPSGAVYVGRGSPWGNPFQIGRNGDRKTCIERFRCEVLPSLDVRPLIGKDLACYCAPLPCHGDLLLRAAEYHERKGGSKTSLERERGQQTLRQHARVAKIAEWENDGTIKVWYIYGAGLRRVMCRGHFFEERDDVFPSEWMCAQIALASVGGGKPVDQYALTDPDRTKRNPETGTEGDVLGSLRTVADLVSMERAGLHRDGRVTGPDGDDSDSKE